ncbi:MAG TPA: hypothetical protein VHD91_00980 [Gaiellaceae bacterium]|nr:hypothetical protein [Gaiellaceae bacterium]
MRRLVAVASVALAAVPAAHAGGTQAGVVAARGRVWALAGGSAVELDRTSGRIVRSVRGRYPFATALAFGGGSVWLSSVENGFVSGSVTRIPPSGRITSPLVLPGRPVFALASDGSSAWALVGPWRDPRLARIDGVRVRTFSSHGVGFLTSGAGAVYGLTSWGTVIRIAHDGRAHVLARLRGADGPPVAGAGSLWVPRGSTLVRLDPRDGRTLGILRLGGSASSLVFSGDTAWAAVLHHDAFRLERLDPRTMRVTAARTIPNRAPQLSYGNGALWLADGDLRVWRVDPRTLARRLFAQLD